MSEPLATVTDLRVTLGGAPTLRGVSFEIREAEAVALLGANGSGKSTLLRGMLGLQPIDSGVVRTASGRDRLAYVPQERSLVASASVLTNVLHGRLGSRGGWRCVSQAIASPRDRRAGANRLHRVGLAGKATARAGTLSGGEAQRCAIARAMMREPAVLLADEPTAALDPATRGGVLGLLREVASERLASVLFSTHSPEDALEWSDRVLGLRGGEIVLDAPASALDAAELHRLYDTPAADAKWGPTP